MIMIEIFKTNVQKIADSLYIIDSIKKQFPNYQINFDLEDCDKILRIESDTIVPKNIVDCVNNLGFTCIILE